MLIIAGPTFSSDLEVTVGLTKICSADVKQVYIHQVFPLWNLFIHLPRCLLDVRSGLQRPRHQPSQKASCVVLITQSKQVQIEKN